MGLSLSGVEVEEEGDRGSGTTREAGATESGAGRTGNNVAGGATGIDTTGVVFVAIVDIAVGGDAGEEKDKVEEDEEQVTMGMEAGRAGHWEPAVISRVDGGG